MTTRTHIQTTGAPNSAVHAIAVDAYLYFYPLLTIDLTRKQLTTSSRGRNSAKGR